MEAFERDFAVHLLEQLERSSSLFRCRVGSIGTETDVAVDVDFGSHTAISAAMR